MRDLSSLAERTRLDEASLSVEIPKDRPFYGPGAAPAFNSPRH
jgi:hypothetical protein